MNVPLEWTFYCPTCKKEKLFKTTSCIIFQSLTIQCDECGLKLKLTLKPKNWMQFVEVNKEGQV